MVNPRFDVRVRGQSLMPQQPRPSVGVKTMRVYATNEKFAKNMNHVVGRLGRMRFTSDGWAEWPDDQFTRRRLRDGDVTLEPPKKTERLEHHKRTARSET